MISFNVCNAHGVQTEKNKKRFIFCRRRSASIAVTLNFLVRFDSAAYLMRLNQEVSLFMAQKSNVHWDIGLLVG